MVEQTVKEGNTRATQKDVMVFSLEPGGEAVVKHEIGKPEVRIRSNYLEHSTIPVEGADRLKLLRDALIRICEVEHIS